MILGILETSFLSIIYHYYLSIKVVNNKLNYISSNLMFAYVGGNLIVITCYAILAALIIDYYRQYL